MYLFWLPRIFAPPKIWWPTISQLPPVKNGFPSNFSLLPWCLHWPLGFGTTAAATSILAISAQIPTFGPASHQKPSFFPIKWAIQSTASIHDGPAMSMQGFGGMCQRNPKIGGQMQIGVSLFLGWGKEYPTISSFLAKM
jgi:hypothetical protein